MKYPLEFTFTVTMKGKGLSEDSAYVDAVLEFEKNPMAAERCSVLNGSDQASLTPAPAKTTKSKGKR